MAALLPVSALAALLVGGPAALLLYHVDPFGLAGQFTDLMSASELGSFRMVWSLHAALYLGGIVGTVYAVVSIQRRRKRIAEGMQSSSSAGILNRTGAPAHDLRNTP